MFSCVLVQVLLLVQFSCDLFFISFFMVGAINPHFIAVDMKLSYGIAHKPFPFGVILCLIGFAGHYFSDYIVVKIPWSSGST